MYCLDNNNFDSCENVLVNGNGNCLLTQTDPIKRLGSGFSKVQFAKDTIERDFVLALAPSPSHNIGIRLY